MPANRFRRRTGSQSPATKGTVLTVNFAGSDDINRTDERGHGVDRSGYARPVQPNDTPETSIAPESQGEPPRDDDLTPEQCQTEALRSLRLRYTGCPADAKIVAPLERTTVQQIRTRGPEATLDLRIEALYHLVLSEVSGRHADLVRVAAYVFRANLAVSRGGERDSDAWRWSRHLALCIPVAEPEFWNRDEIRSALSSTLSFLTGDRWDFWFSQADADIRQIPLELTTQDRYEPPEL